MSIRLKLIATYLAVALLVPVLGCIAVRNVGDVRGDADALNRRALPALAAVEELKQAHGEQTTAALMYLASGRDEEQRRAVEGAERFDRVLASLKQAEPAPSDAGSERLAALATALEGEQTKLTAAAGQIVNARATIDRNLTDLRARNADIGQELGQVRRRIAGGEAATAGAIAPALRREHGDLLLAIEGMQQVVNLELGLASAYAVRRDESLQRQFEGAGLIFTTWLQLANGAAGAEDRQTLARVQTKFFREFEPSARSVFLAADFATSAGGVFAEADRGVADSLGRMALEAAGRTERAGGSVEATADQARTVVVAITIAAFVLAGALGVWFARTITRPIVQLRNAAERLSRGDIANLEIDIHSNDEVGDLARAFRRMVLSVRILMTGGGADADAGMSRP